MNPYKKAVLKEKMSVKLIPVRRILQFISFPLILTFQPAQQGLMYMWKAGYIILSTAFWWNDHSVFCSYISSSAWLGAHMVLPFQFLMFMLRSERFLTPVDTLVPPSHQAR